MEPRRFPDVLVAAVVLFCTSVITLGDTVKLSGKQDGQTVAVRVGDEVVLRLFGNPTTGYQWTLEDIAGSSVVPDGIIQYEPIDSDKRIGAGGFFIARFNAVKVGRTAFKLVYTRPWEKNKKPAKAFLITLDAKKPVARPVVEIEAKYLTHSHGKLEGHRSIAGSGYGVVFETPQENQKLIAIQIFASRYGKPDVPNQNFYIYLLEPDGKKIIDAFKYPYSQIQRGEMKWYTLKIPPTTVPQKFLLGLVFNPTKTRGVQVGYTRTTVPSFSRIGLPGKGFTTVQKPVEWMVRTFFEAPEAAAANAQKAPQVIFTFPSAMSNNVDSGVNKIIAKFDRPMMPKSFSWTGGEEFFPKIIGVPFYDKKLTTCVLPVRLIPGHVYWVGVNSPTHQFFQTEKRVPAGRYVILFATKNKDGLPTAIPQDMLSKARAINAQTPLFAIEADRKISRKLTAEGWKLWKQNNFFEAEKLFSQALEKDSQNADAWNGLGWSNLNQNERFDAGFDFNKCLALDPRNPSALNGLGWIAKSQGKIDDAIAFWKRSIDSAPNATAALNGLGSTCLEKKDYEQAVLYYKMWLKIEPNNETANAGLKKAREGRRAGRGVTSKSDGLRKAD